MNSTPNPAATDPNDALVARADQRLADAYQKIAQADEQLARITEQISKLDQGAKRHPAAVARPSRSRPGLRALSGLLLAACIFAAAFVSQSSYGDAAKRILAQWSPQLASALSLPQKEPAPGAQSAPSAIQLAAAGPAPLQAASPSQTTQQVVAPAAAPASDESEQLLQSMAHNLADLQQQIEQLKASQQQMANDNAKAFEDIKASQQQLAGLVAMISDQNRRLTALAPSPPIGTTTHKPAPAAHPQAPVRLRPEGQ